MYGQGSYGEAGYSEEALLGTAYATTGIRVVNVTTDERLYISESDRLLLIAEQDREIQISTADRIVIPDDERSVNSGIGNRTA